MSTIERNRPETLILLISGYHREADVVHTIPDDVNQIILQYFLFDDFKFENACDCFIVSDNKLEMTLKKERFGTIQFGPFLTESDKIIYRVKFVMERIYPFDFAFGFIAPEFNQWDRGRGYNRGHENLVIVYGSTFHLASPEFQAINSQYKSGGSYLAGPNIIDENKLVLDGDHVEIVMNMFEKRGIIAFYHKEESGHIEDLPFFSAEINLLNVVAIILDGGGYEQTVRVIDQSFQYV